MLAIALLCGCDGGAAGGTEAKAATAAAQKLATEEQQLLERRGALQRERTRLRDKRVALIGRKIEAATDEQAKRAVEAEESKLAGLEAKLATQEIALNKQLDKLLRQKDSLARGLSKTESRALLVARRENSVASRERALSRREAELAQREKGFAEREQSFAQRQARLCPVATTTVVQVPVRSKSKSGRYSRSDVEPIYRSALKAMRKKGILTIDLPAGIDRLVTETRHAVGAKDYTRAKFAADQLLASVRRIKINRSFVGAKIGRLSQAMRRRAPAADARSRVTALFQKATAHYGDGRFSAANRALNQIYALLR